MSDKIEKKKKLPPKIFFRQQKFFTLKCQYTKKAFPPKYFVHKKEGKEIKVGKKEKKEILGKYRVQSRGDYLGNYYKEV